MATIPGSGTACPIAQPASKCALRPLRKDLGRASRAQKCGAALHGKLSNVSESPAAPCRSRASAKSSRINLKEFATEHSTPVAAMEHRSRELAKSTRHLEACKGSYRAHP